MYKQGPRLGTVIAAGLICMVAAAMAVLWVPEDAYIAEQQAKKAQSAAKRVKSGSTAKDGAGASLRDDIRKNIVAA